MRTPHPLLGFASVLTIVVALACSSSPNATVSAEAADHACATEAPCDASRVDRPSGVALKPWEPVDEDYRGCEGACGTSATAGSPDTIPQPGVAVGQLTYCLVSGVTIRVKEAGPRRDVAGTPVHFCCEACAVYFSEHEAAVSRARGLDSR